MASLFLQILTCIPPLTFLLPGYGHNYTSSRTVGGGFLVGLRSYINPTYPTSPHYLGALDLLKTKSNNKRIWTRRNKRLLTWYVKEDVWLGLGNQKQANKFFMINLLWPLFAHNSNDKWTNSVSLKIFFFILDFEFYQL